MGNTDTGHQTITELFLDCEGFDALGGWVVDQQSIETLGSSYIMAHGMGVPVDDAVTSVMIPADGEYSFWVRTHDWTACFGRGTPAGRFTLGADGDPLPAVLGTNGVDWAWQKAGRIFLTAGKHSLSLHDLTGFNGRADAIYITSGDNTPDNSLHGTELLRSRLCGDTVEDDPEQFDLIVAGAGIAGICFALSAMRSGLNVLLISDRPLLGGCNSSETRVCMGGCVNRKPYPEIGNVVRDIQPIDGDPRIFDADHYEDKRKQFAFGIRAYRRRHRIVYNQHVVSCEKEGRRVKSIVTMDTHTGKKTRYTGKLFADCSGDAFLARNLGCETMYGRDGFDAFGESLAPATHENLVMGHSIRWYSEKSAVPTEFPDIDWAIPFDEATCYHVRNGDWEQEAGFRRNMVTEIERIRDYGLLAIYSNWAFQKNRSQRKEEYRFDTLKWVSSIGGKRESYRVKGDLVLTQNDIETPVLYDDGTAVLTWTIDIHFPEPDNEERFGEAFRSCAYHRGIVNDYPVPYRCLYARDVDNLFLGGRDISLSHIALSSARVMRTLGCLAEVAGLAASLCIEKDCTPRQVYIDYLPEFKEKLTKGVPLHHAFDGHSDSSESYHFKELGYVHFGENRCDSPDGIDKFARNIQKIGLKHKYPVPDALKGKLKE